MGDIGPAQRRYDVLPEHAPIHMTVPDPMPVPTPEPLPDPDPGPAPEPVPQPPSLSTHG